MGIDYDYITDVKNGPEMSARINAEIERIA